MSKLDSLVSVMERAEKQALALFLVGESKQNDSTALSMLRKRGIPEPEQVLELLKQITVDGTENGQPVWSLSNTGKEIQPLAGWYCSTWNEGDDAVQARERVADTVHKMFQIPSARNQELTKVWLANRDLTAFEAWLTKMYEKDKAKGKIVDAEEGEVVDVGAYNFPKKMLAYSDKYVDCYRADTPAEAMLLGDGYSFCISRRDGSNMFYSYRMNPTTTAYFCWFKDENGNKTKSNMCVLHVGKDGKYMATPSQNGAAPRESAQEVVMKYPGLRNAIKHLVVKPATKMEDEIRRRFNFRSKVPLEDIEGKSPEYIELVIAHGVRLKDDAFEYIFNEIDNKNLRTGNNGNSLIKKYIETGIHKLSRNQRKLLIEAGYESEVLRGLEVYLRSQIAAENEITLPDFKTALVKIDKLDISKKDSLIRSYISRWLRLKPEEAAYIDKVSKTSPKLKKGLDALLNGSLLRKMIDALFTGGVKIVPVEDGFDVYPERDNRRCTIYAPLPTFDFALDTGKILSKVKRIVGCDLLILSNFKKDIVSKVTSFPKIPSGVEVLLQSSSLDILSFIRDKISRLVVKGETVEGSNKIDAIKDLYCNELRAESASWTSGTMLPKRLERLYIGSWAGKDIDISTLPRKMESVSIGSVDSLLNPNLEGIPDEVDILVLGYNENIAYFPKKVGIWTITDFNRTQVIPDCIKESDIKSIKFEDYLVDSSSVPKTDVVNWVLGKIEKTKIEKGEYIQEIKVLEDGGICLVVIPSFALPFPSFPFPSIPWDKPVQKILGATDYSIKGLFNFSDLPSVLEGGGRSLGTLYVEESWLDVLTLDHSVEGIESIIMYRNKNFKGFKGLENFKDLKSVKLYDTLDYYGVPAEDVVKSIPKNIKVVIRGKVVQKGDSNESLSLSLSPLRVALNSISE